MIPVSGTAPRPAAAQNVPKADGPALPVSRPEAGSPVKPSRDEYVPEEKQEPCGRYWLGKDEDGGPKIYFDSPEAAEDAPVDDAPAAPSSDGSRKAERCTCSTGKVDREIEKLKEKKEELEKQLDSETDETRAKDLESRLARVEDELRRKDNDAYRRRHSVFT